MSPRPRAPPAAPEGSPARRPARGTTAHATTPTHRSPTPGAPLPTFRALFWSREDRIPARRFPRPVPGALSANQGRAGTPRRAAPRAATGEQKARGASGGGGWRAPGARPGSGACADAAGSRIRVPDRSGRHGRSCMPARPAAAPTASTCPPSASYPTVRFNPSSVAHHRPGWPRPPQRPRAAFGSAIGLGMTTRLDTGRDVPRSGSLPLKPPSGRADAMHDGTTCGLGSEGAAKLQLADRVAHVA